MPTLNTKIRPPNPNNLAAVLLAFTLAACASNHTINTTPRDGGGLTEAVQSAPRQTIDPALAHVSSALHHFLVGQLAYEKEDYPAAMSNFSAADALIPGGIPWLSARLAELLVKEGQLPAALKESEKALLADNADTRALLLHAGILEGLQRINDAVPIYERVIKEHPDNIDAHILLASVFAKQGDPKKAETLLIKILSTVGEKSVIVHYYLGRVREMQENLSGAEKSYRRVLELDPENISVATELLRVLIKTKQLNEAKKLCGALLEMEPTNAVARRVLGSIFLGERNLDEALTHFKVLEGLEPDPIESRFKIALIQIEKQNYEEAARELVLVLAQNPRQSIARYYLASLYAGAGRRGEAVSELLKMEPADEMYLKGRLLAAFLLRQDKKFEDAAAAARIVVSQTPTDYNAVAALVAILRDQHEYEAALKVLVEAEQGGVSPEKILFLKGLVLEEKGDKSAAFSVMSRVVDLNAKHGDALNFMAFALAEKNIDLDKALSFAERAVAVNSNDGFYLDTLGWVYFRRADFPQAEKILERAAGLQPTDLVIQEHYGLVLEALAKPARAHEVYLRALSAAGSDLTPEDRAALERMKKKVKEYRGQ